MGNSRIFHDFRPLGVRASQDPDPPPKVRRGRSQQQPHRGPFSPGRGRPGRCGGQGGLGPRRVRGRATVPPAGGRPPGTKGAAATRTRAEGPPCCPPQLIDQGAPGPQSPRGTEAWKGSWSRQDPARPALGVGAACRPTRVDGVTGVSGLSESSGCLGTSGWGDQRWPAEGPGPQHRAPEPIWALATAEGLEPG